MRYYSWGKLFLMLVLQPKSLFPFLRLPRTYTSLKHWLEIDKIKCEIMAKVFRCRSANTLWEQQQRNMVYRNSVAKNFNDWMKKVRANPSLREPIAVIADEFVMRRKCHRKYRPPGAGVYCYCDEHKH